MRRRFLKCVANYCVLCKNCHNDYKCINRNDIAFVYKNYNPIMIVQVSNFYITNCAMEQFLLPLLQFAVLRISVNK